MTDKKIVFFDIDGTIYKFNCGIPDDTKKSIKKLKENGHIPVICTGRTRSMIYDEFLEPGFDYVIAGAGTYAEAIGEELFNYTLEDEVAGEIIEGFFKYGFSPVAEGRDDIYIEYDNQYLTEITTKVLETYKNRMGEHCKNVHKDKRGSLSKVSAVFTTKSDVEGMTEAFKDRYTVINHDNHLLELVPIGFSKARGIEELITRLAIPRKHTYAFGDSFNDLEMLQYVEYGVAMGNSHPDLFNYTKYRTDDFDKGGITNALKRFGLI